jgi:glycine/D-amino acid oxidase-like deaminating enzyme
VPDVVVVGGGAVGCASAWFLSREGFSVTLLERGELAG